MRVIILGSNRLRLDTTERLRTIDPSSVSVMGLVNFDDGFDSSSAFIMVTDDVLGHRGIEIDSAGRVVLLKGASPVLQLHPVGA